jgi:DnaJ like chaperone protein
MGWLGKIVGGAIGFALGGPIGAVAGATFGHAFDLGDDTKYLEGNGGRLSEGEQEQLTFFVGAFSMLAKLAEVDGKVSDQEIQTIDRFMSQDLHLDSNSRKVAINIFRTARQSPETFERFASQFYQQFRYRPQMIEMMMDILLRVSVADGSLSDTEERLIMSAVHIFNFNPAAYQKLKSKYVDTSDKYYATLGCSRNDSNDHIKKQYRKLVQEYHPDKIAAKGLPDEFIAFAGDKFREIQEAYEAVKEERSLS